MTTGGPGPGKYHSSELVGEDADKSADRHSGEGSDSVLPHLKRVLARSATKAAAEMPTTLDHYKRSDGGSENGDGAGSVERLKRSK